MRLNVGDILYFKDQTKPENQGPFKVTKIRPKPSYRMGLDGDDICIQYEGHDWWWGQIGEFEPWTIMFMTEKQYLRDKKLDQILS